MEKAKQLRNLTNADLGKITQILEDKEGELDLFSDFSVWMRLTYKMDVQGISKWVDNLSLKGRKQQNLFLSYAIKMVRECLIYNFASEIIVNSKDFKKNLKKKLDIKSSYIYNPIITNEKFRKKSKKINMLF